MPGGIAVSAVMHVAILALIIIGLPTLFRPPIPEDQPIAVELVTIAPETRATRPNPNMPQPNAKPDIPIEAAPAPMPSRSPNRRRRPPAAPPSARRRRRRPPRRRRRSPKPPPPPPRRRPSRSRRRPRRRRRPSRSRSRNPTEAGGRSVRPMLKNLEKSQPKQVAQPNRKPSQQAAGRAGVRHAVEEPGRRTPSRPTRTRSRGASRSPPPRRPRRSRSAPLGSQLTASEIDLVREQISRCWNMQCRRARRQGSRASKSAPRCSPTAR